MTKIRACATFTFLLLLGVVAYGFWLSRKLFHESDGWISRDDAILELGFDHSSLPRTTTKIRYRRMFGLGHGQSLHYVCDGDLDELNEFAKDQVQAIADQIESDVVIKQSEGNDDIFLFREMLSEGVLSPPAADCVKYYVRDGGPIFIVVDQTHEMLYYQWGD